LPSKQPHSFSHSSQSLAAALSGTGLAGSWIETFAVITNRAVQVTVCGPGADLDETGLGVFDNVVQTFLHNPVQVDLRLSSQQTIERLQLG